MLLYHVSPRGNVSFRQPALIILYYVLVYLNQLRGEGVASFPPVETRLFVYVQFTAEHKIQIVHRDVRATLTIPGVHPAKKNIYITIILKKNQLRLSCR